MASTRAKITYQNVGYQITPFFQINKLSISIYWMDLIIVVGAIMSQVIFDMCDKDLSYANVVDNVVCQVKYANARLDKLMQVHWIQKSKLVTW